MRGILFLLFASTSIGEVPPISKDLATKAAAAIGQTLTEHHADVDENFVALAKRLKSLGFGQPPLDPPPWHQAEPNLDPKIQKDRDDEMKIRLKTIGEHELTLLKSLDANGDRSIDEAEVRDTLLAQLKATLEERLDADSDDDSRLNLKEYVLVVPARGEISEEDGADWHQRGHFQDEDANKDGFLDATELLGHEAAGFHKAALRTKVVHHLATQDKNADGTLTKEECANLWADEVPLKMVYPAIYWFPVEKLEALLPQK